MKYYVSRLWNYMVWKLFDIGYFLLWDVTDENGDLFEFLDNELNKESLLRVILTDLSWMESWRK